MFRCDSPAVGSSSGSFESVLNALPGSDPVDPPAASCLNRFCIAACHKMGSHYAKLLSIVLIALGIAAFFTGLGASAGVTMMLAGGALLAVSGGISIYNCRVAAKCVSADLTVVTYNVMGDYSNFERLCGYNETEALEIDYLISQKKMAAMFLELVRQTRVDVIMLQAAYDNQFLVCVLEGQGFVICRLDQPNFNNLYTDDCVILLRSNRFEVSHANYELIDGLHASIILARDKMTRQTCMLATAHIPRTDTVQPDESIEQAQSHINYVQRLGTLMNNLSTENGVAIQFFSAGMNLDLQQGDETFAMLSELGFNKHSASDPTELNSMEPGSIAKKPDHLFTRTGKLSTMDWLRGKSALQISTVSTEILMGDAVPDDDVPVNASNHHPVLRKFRIDPRGNI